MIQSPSETRVGAGHTGFITITILPWDLGKTCDQPAQDLIKALPLGSSHGYHFRGTLPVR